METFLECETIVASHHLVFVGSLAEIDPRKVAERVRRLRHKNDASATHFFALSPKPMARFRWKRARLSIFRPQSHLPIFFQIHPSFRNLLAKTTFQIVTIYTAIRSLQWNLEVTRSLAGLQLYDSEFQTEEELTLKAFADIAGASRSTLSNKKAVLSQGNRAMPQLFFWV